MFILTLPGMILSFKEHCMMMIFAFLLMMFILTLLMKICLSFDFQPISRMTRSQALMIQF